MATQTQKGKKVYTILHITQRGSEYTLKGTLEELIEKVSYRLECGASWQWERGCKKVNRNPKTIKALITALENAIHNTQGSCYNRDCYIHVTE